MNSKRARPWKHTPPRSERIVSAVGRIAQVLRNGAWQFGTAHGLNPTQVDMLDLLRGRRDAVRLSWVAEQLRVSAASASDSIAALVAKGLVEKTRAVDDARALALTLTDAGRELAAGITGAQGFAHEAVEALPDATQDQLLRGLLQMIGQLQRAERFPELRSCLSCRHFRADAHADAAAPHHCALVDAPLSVALLRLDCAEHEPADAAQSRAQWRVLQRA